VNDRFPRPIALVGLMGAGKSAVARLLGERLQVPVADLDQLLEAAGETTIAEIFQGAGEAAFRRRESEMLLRTLDTDAGVLACGGGVVLDPAHRKLLRERCRTVWLEVTPETAAGRIGPGAASRPLLDGGPVRERLNVLLEARAPLYAEVAAARVPTDGRTVAEVAEAVLEALHEVRA
jgi:shikimate kinase